MTVAWVLLGVALLVAFVAYPRLMLGLTATIVRGVFNVIIDGVALLLAWI
jgi:hypothetical protein